MNKYELALILDGKTTPAKVKSFKERLQKVLELLKGKVIKQEELGKQTFAQKLGRIDSGYYIFFDLELDAQSARSLNEKLRTEEYLIRFLLLKA